MTSISLHVSFDSYRLRDYVVIFYSTTYSLVFSWCWPACDKFFSFAVCCLFQLHRVVLGQPLFLSLLVHDMAILAVLLQYFQSTWSVCFWFLFLSLSDAIIPKSLVRICLPRASDWQLQEDSSVTLNLQLMYTSHVSSAFAFTVF